MKKWIGIAVVLVCFVVYAMVKLSTSQYQDAHTPEEATPSAKQIDAGNTDEAGQEEDSGSPGTAVQTDEAAHEEDSGTPATAAQIEAVTRVFREFLSAVESEDYEQAWKLTSKSLKSRASFEEFKEEMPDMRAEILKSTIRPESATSIGGRVRVPITNPSHGDDHAFFVQEDGRWKLEM